MKDISSFHLLKKIDALYWKEDNGFHDASLSTTIKVNDFNRKVETRNEVLDEVKKEIESLLKNRTNSKKP